jgi:hypothetical protein
MYIKKIKTNGIITKEQNLRLKRILLPLQAPLTLEFGSPPSQASSQINSRLCVCHLFKLDLSYPE